MATETEILETALRAMDAEITRLTAALEMIAGRRPCPDNLLGNADIARMTLDRKTIVVSSAA